MRLLAVLLSLCVLTACGASGGATVKTGGESSVASVTSSPAPEAFSVAKGDTQTLSVTVTRKSPDVAKLELSTVLGPDGVDVSPAAYTFDFAETAEESFTLEFEVRVEAYISNPAPHFYIYAKALDERGRPVGSETLRLKYQWDL